MKSVLLAVSTVTLAFLSSCLSHTWTALEITERKLSFPTRYYSHVVYLDGKLIGFSEDTNVPLNNQISFAFEGDKVTTLFQPGKDPTCTRYIFFYVNGILPDGRLGLIKECAAGKDAPADLSTQRSIYAFDWHTKKLEPLITGRVYQGFGPKFYTWNPEMTLGVQETSGSYRGTIYWISPEGVSPMDIEIEDRGLSWNLKDYLDGKENTGFARHPAWSPDGKTIAFFVSTYGILEEPKPKFNVNYDLFFMSPSTQEPKQELMDIVDAGKIVWSPNNEFLLFRGCVGRNLTCGLWRYRIADKSLSLIKEGEFADYIWITNDKIIAAKNVDLPYKDNEIWEYSIIE